jgi:hypothetical protein
MLVKLMGACKSCSIEGEPATGERRSRGAREEANCLDGLYTPWSTGFSIVLSEGFVYEGETEEGVPHGRGKMVHPNQDVYEGDWVHGKAEGFGVYTKHNWGKYQGEYQNDLQHGVGREEWADGSHYEGSYSLGMKHGLGRFTWPDGTAYTGDFF